MQTIVLGRAGFVKGVPRLRLTARTIKRGVLRGGDNWAMNTTSVIYSTTTELSEAIRGRELSAREVLDAHIAQIERHNPAVNAVVIHDIEKARERARAADDALARDESWGPLHGVPFTLKDAHATAGVRNTLGFPAFDHVPPHDGTVAARLKAAGAILVGKTNVATLLGDYQTSNTIFGRTNNPWNLERTPGGSSGGAAAAIASGMTPFDVGTDLSSSIRLPAHFCGIYGLKPTEHRISLNGVFPLPFESPRPVRIMSCVGPMARTASDLALLYRVLAGPDGIDTDVHPVPVENVSKATLQNVRVAVARDFGGFPVAADIRNAIDAFAGRLETHGAIVEYATLPNIDYYSVVESAAELIQMMTGDPHAPASSLAQYITALSKRDHIITQWERFFDEWDVLVTPASMTTAFAHVQPGTPLRVDGREENYYLVSGHGTFWNYTGHPAIVMPFGSDRDKLPIGVQLVTKRWNESRLLAIAEAFEKAQPLFQRPPGY